MPEENKRLRLEIARLREELEAAHMTISLQQECLFKGYKMEDFQKCLHCHKIFTNHSYLVSHIERRHRTTEAGGVERGTSRDHKETQTENPWIPSPPTTPRKNKYSFKTKAMYYENNIFEILP